jgi:hypothetical protein
MLSIGTVVVGVNDVGRAAGFWQQALGYVPRDELQDDWAVLIPSDGGPGSVGRFVRR